METTIKVNDIVTCKEIKQTKGQAENWAEMDGLVVGGKYKILEISPDEYWEGGFAVDIDPVDQPGAKCIYSHDISLFQA